MKKWLARFIHETEGQDLIEFALLGATLAIAVTLAMQGVRGALQTRFNAIRDGLGFPT
jgi:Flp pilus assembly pilin Flp